MVSDADKRRVVAALTRDVVATLGTGYERDITLAAVNQRQRAANANEFAQRVVQAERLAADDYERDAAYGRTVMTLASGVDAWVYKTR